VLAARGVHVVHNPRSNANNAVGYARPGRFAGLCLGTDGIGADMRHEGLAAFLFAREHGERLDVLTALDRNRQLGAQLLGHPPPAIAVGAAADLVAYEAPLPTPLSDDNLSGHLLFGATAARARHVLVGGRPIVVDGRVPGVDEERLYARGREAAARLWERMRTLTS
jgi:cytosine/adenosine deaminase-related metal-dependent hydrolase